MTDADDAPEFPTPSIVDSRRLMGANVYSDCPGAVLDVRCCFSLPDDLLTDWMVSARVLAGAIGWQGTVTQVRMEEGGASLFVSAPVDGLMTATELNEQAWVLAESDQAVEPPLVARLREMAVAEHASRTVLERTYRAARIRGLFATFDDEQVTLGAGAGSRTWALPDLPTPDGIPWGTIGDVPISLVTGSNGKTTTTRLVSAMWRAAGRVPGWCCSDGVWIGDEQVETGDYSGPGGARMVLSDRRVEAAVLETARGGILRRGLAESRADAAIITNISADHFGEYGMSTERDLADAKAVVARVLGPHDCLVLNADDEHLVALGSRVRNRIGWFSTSPEHLVLQEHARRRGDAATVYDGRLMLHWDEAWHDLGLVVDMPLTLRGAAPHNVQNALGAALLAVASGVPVDAVRETLGTFGARPGDNPGRLHVLDVGGITVVADYAHNPEGLASLCRTAHSFAAVRRLLVLGQAGNRDDNQLRALVQAAWRVMPFDEVVIKEMPSMLRGRAMGEVPAVLASEAIRLGLAADCVHIAPTELTAARQVLSLARRGDLIVCPLHSERAAVLSLFQRLIEALWRAGSPSPELTAS